MTLATNAPAIDPAWLAELTAELATYGYKVTKARATRASTSTESAARADGCEPVKVKASKRHGSCAAHFRVPGMREPVCIAPATDESGTAIPAEWSDVDTVLAFAVDVGRRTEEHRTRASIGYVGADQSTSSVGYSPTLDPNKGRSHTMHALPKEWTAYGLRVGCDKCTALKAEHDAAEVRKAEQERMKGTPHAFTSPSSYMATCTACGASRRHESHEWQAHAFVSKYGRCATCERTEEEHAAAA